MASVNQFSRFFVFLCFVFIVSLRFQSEWIFGNSVEIVLATSTPQLTEMSSTTVSEFTSVVINEVMPEPNEGEKEWIELYNTGTSTVLLDGGTVNDEVGVIAFVTGTLPAGGYAVIELSKTALNNTGDGIFFRFEGEVIDSLVYGNAKTDPIDIKKLPGVHRTIGRMSDGTYALTATTTKGYENIFLEVPIDIDEPIVTTTAQVVEPGVIIISEFVSDPADEMGEFVELYNKGDGVLDITGWYIEDDSETKTMLVGEMLPQQFFVIEKPKGALNNTGDSITLYTEAGVEIDRVVYGNSDDGNLLDNAPVASDPMSIARNMNMTDTGNDTQDFFITTRITKGSMNEIIAPVEQTRQTESLEELTEKAVIISELFPNPKGSDTETEYIELVNISGVSVDITGWKLGDNSKTRYTITTTVMQPGEYRAFFRKETKISLNNSGSERAVLFTATGIIADSIIYEGATPEDESYARETNNLFSWTTTRTPDKENIIIKKNHIPQAVVVVPKTSVVGETVILDASDTTDEEQDVLVYSWFVNDEKIGDGELVEYMFQHPGKYTVSLAVGDGINETVTEKKTIDIKTDTHDLVLSGLGEYEKTLRISELFPDPEGSDTETEFIEIYNTGDMEVDIGGWYLDDVEGGSRAYIIPEGTIIGGKQYMVFDREITRIALNNTDDSVRLLFPDKTVVEEIRMHDVVEGAAYIPDEQGEWGWSSDVTPGEANKMTTLISLGTPKKIVGKDGKISIKTTIEDLRDHETGDVVFLQGTVAVKPGVFSATVFYIVNKAGIQIMMPKKLLPTLEVGDSIEVTGTLGEINNERRLSVKKKEDLRIIRPGIAPEIQKEEIAMLSEEKIGSLGMVEGEVVEKKGTSIFVDDGTAEIAAILPKGVKPKDSIKEGDIIRIAGIIRRKGDEIYLMPRSVDDIQKIGVVTTTSTIEPTEQKEKINSKPYVLLTGLSACIISIGWFIKKEKPPFSKWKNFGILCAWIIFFFKSVHFWVSQ